MTMKIMIIVIIVRRRGGRGKRMRRRAEVKGDAGNRKEMHIQEVEELVIKNARITTEDNR